MEFAEVAAVAGTVLDAVGVAVIVVGALVAVGVFGYRVLRGQTTLVTYGLFRQGLGRSILLGLEFLVAGDIIRTVAVSPTFRTVGVLALIVLVRTLLSFSLQVELEGRWPWQPRGAAGGDAGARGAGMGGAEPI